MEYLYWPRRLDVAFRRKILITRIFYTPSRVFQIDLWHAGTLRLKLPRDVSYSFEGVL